MGLYQKTAGTILYKGRDVEDPDVSAMYKRQVQMIFQDPYASLDPRMTVEESIAEPFVNYGIVRSRQERRRAVASLLQEVDLSKEAAQRYPHEFSGGQRQRIGIARALALGPKCIFAMNLYLLWMYRCRYKSSICSNDFRKSAIYRISLLPMTCL